MNKAGSFIGGDYLYSLINNYVDGYSYSKGLKTATIRGKRDSLNRLYRYLNGGELDLKSVQGYLNSLKKHGLNGTPWSNTSLIAEIRRIRAFLNYLDKTSILKSFADLIPVPKSDSNPRNIVSSKMAEKIIIAGTSPGSGDNSINIQRKINTSLALRFILRTGLRPAELQRIKVSDFIFDEEYPAVWVERRKNKRSEGKTKLPLPLDLIEELKNTVGKGRAFPVTQKHMNTCLSRGCKIIGKEIITTYSLRVIFCTTTLKHGATLSMVSKLMGHDNPQLTHSIYTKYDISDLSIAMNTFQPIIASNIPTSEALSMFENYVKKGLNLIFKGKAKYKISLSEDDNAFSLQVFKSV